MIGFWKSRSKELSWAVFSGKYQTQWIPNAAGHLPVPVTVWYSHSNKPASAVLAKNVTQCLMYKLEQGKLSLCWSCSPMQVTLSLFPVLLPTCFACKFFGRKNTSYQVRYCYCLRAAFFSTVLLSKSVLCVQDIFLRKLDKLKVRVAQPPLFNAHLPELFIPKWCQRMAITVVSGTFVTTANISPLCTTNDHRTPAWGIFFKSDTLFFSKIWSEKWDFFNLS